MLCFFLNLHFDKMPLIFTRLQVVNCVTNVFNVIFYQNLGQNMLSIKIFTLKLILNRLTYTAAQVPMGFKLENLSKIGSGRLNECDFTLGLGKKLSGYI